MGKRADDVIQEIQKRAHDLSVDYPGYSQGQDIFTAAARLLGTSLVNHCVGSPADCWADDSRIPDFLFAIRELVEAP